ncbi:hypothetical protein BST61_g6359 [Cercospora zeina]
MEELPTSSKIVIIAARNSCDAYRNHCATSPRRWCLSKLGVANFSSIASSGLAQHVGKLVVFSHTLPKFTKAAWEESIDMRPNFRL